MPASRAWRQQGNSAAHEKGLGAVDNTQPDQHGILGQGSRRLRAGHTEPAAPGGPAGPGSQARRPAVSRLRSRCVWTSVDTTGAVALVLAPEQQGGAAELAVMLGIACVCRSVPPIFLFAANDVAGGHGHHDSVTHEGLTIHKAARWHVATGQAFAGLMW